MKHPTSPKLLPALLAIALICDASPVRAQRRHVSTFTQTAPNPAPASTAATAPDATPPAAPAPLQAPLGSGIAAVVNDNVITTTDLIQRMNLALMSSGLPNTPEVRAHLLPQVLRGMIDEQLQAQEAKRLDITVSNDEIDKALARIATENHIPGDMRSFVADHGGSASALEDQVRTGLLWNKIIQREIRPKVEVGDDEVDAVIERERANAGKDEYLVSEIYLAVDNPKDEEQVKQVATNLVDQIRHGASFAAVARQFSQDASGAQGGDIGWVQQGQLAPELNKALTVAAPGEISAPIRTTNGFHILGLRDKRRVSLGDPTQASVELTQAFRPIGAAASDADTAQREANRLRATVKSCADLTTTLAANFPTWKAQKLGEMNLAKAPGWITDKVRNVPVNGSSAPLPANKGVVVLFVCSRKDSADIDRDAITHTLGTAKMELQARRLQRDLRRKAYIDIRLGQNHAGDQPDATAAPATADAAPPADSH